MAAIESLFRYPSREIKEMIMNNYENVGSSLAQMGNDESKFECASDEAIDYNNF
jgi:hypothetical protein